MTAAGKMEEYELLRQEGGEQRRQPFEELEQHVFEPLPLHTASKQPPGLLRKYLLRPRLRSLLLAAALLAVAISVFVIMTVKNVSGATSQEPTSGLSMIRGGYADKLLIPVDDALGALGKGGAASDTPQDAEFTQTAYLEETTLPTDDGITSASSDDTTNEAEDVMSEDISALETPPASTGLFTTAPTNNDTTAPPSPFPTDNLTLEKQVLANADGLEKSYETKVVDGESTLVNPESTVPWPISSQPSQTSELSPDSPAQNESSISAGLENKKGPGGGNGETNAGEGNVKGNDAAPVNGNSSQENDLEKGKGNEALNSSGGEGEKGEEGEGEAGPIENKVSIGAHEEHANITNSGPDPEPASSVFEGVQPPKETADDGGDGRTDTQLDGEPINGSSSNIFAKSTNASDPTSTPASSAETGPADTLQSGFLPVDAAETSATAAATVTETPSINTSDVLGTQTTAYNPAHAESGTADHQVQPTDVSEKSEGGNLFTGTVPGTNDADSLAADDLDDIATAPQAQGPLPSVNAAPESNNGTAANFTLANGVLPGVGHDIGDTGPATDAEASKTEEGRHNEKPDQPGDGPDEHEDADKEDDVDESSSAEYSRRRLPRTSIFPDT